MDIPMCRVYHRRQLKAASHRSSNGPLRGNNEGTFNHAAFVPCFGGNKRDALYYNVLVVRFLLNNVRINPFRIMDSGLGSDDDRRSRCSRTKEQKQRLNQQLMSGTHTPVPTTNGTTQAVNGACFIDASTLQDDDELQQQEQFRKLEERRQGALLFQTSIPQYSTIMQPSSDGNPDGDPDTPFNSIVHIPTTEEEEISRRPALGFYVDFADIDVPNEVSCNDGDNTGIDKKKNMFSMVIDFDPPKKEKPTRLGRVRRKSSGNGGGSSECGSDGSSSLGWLGGTGGGSGNCGVGGESGTGSGEALVVVDIEEAVERKEVDEKVVSAGGEVANVKGTQPKEDEETAKEVKFVRLSDLEQPSPSTNEDSPLHNNSSSTSKTYQQQQQHRMSRSIPESSWLESPLSLMSRSTGYYRSCSSSAASTAPKNVTRETKKSSGDDDGNNSLSDSAGSKTGVSQKRLGTDLLRMFLEEVNTDVVLHIGNRSIKAHRCILISRCQYFAGTLRQRSLTLDGFSYEAVHFALCHIYSGAAHVPQAISLVELASLSDLLALEGLKEVVAHELRSRHCHHFHAPCAAGCITGVLEVLPLAASYALDALYHRCLRWIHEHYVHIWPTRAFSRLPSDFQQRCLQQHVVHLSADTVLGTLIGAGQILKALPAPSSSQKSNGSSSSSHWASDIRDLVNRLQEECTNWIRGQFEAVLGYIPLVAGEMDKFEEPLLGVIDLLTLDQTCRSYGRCIPMLANSNVPTTCGIKDFHPAFVTSPINPPHIQLLLKIRDRLEMSLTVRMDRLLRSVTWTKLDSALRGRIKQLFDTFKIDDNLLIGQGRTYHLPHQRPLHSSSSESSSRNSSPATSQIHTSPSLRRSLLLAARAPQQPVQVPPPVPVVPPSPTAARKSTLTKATASSAAKGVKEGPSQGTKQQIHAKTPGNTISKSYHHYPQQQNRSTTTNDKTTIVQQTTTHTYNQIIHTKSTGSITTTETKPCGESPTITKRQIPVRKILAAAPQGKGVGNSPLELRKTVSGTSFGSRKWDGSNNAGNSASVLSKKQSPVSTGGTIGGSQFGQANKRHSPILARYLLPRKRDLVLNNDSIANTNQSNKPPSSTSPMSSPRMRTKSAETAKAQNTKPQKHPQGSVSNTHSPVKIHQLQQNVTTLSQNKLKRGQQQGRNNQSPLKQNVVVSNVQREGSVKSGGSPGKIAKCGLAKIGDVGKKKDVLLNGVHKNQQNKECENKIKRKPGTRTMAIYDRSDSPISFDMTETIVVHSKLTRPAHFDSSLSTWDGSNAGPVSLKSLVDAVVDTSMTSSGTALLQRSGTFLKDEPSVIPTLE